MTEQFSDNPAFRKQLTETIFAATYQAPPPASMTNGSSPAPGANR